MHVGLATGFANHAQVEDGQFLHEEFTQLQLADELGFDSVWITEHHFSDYSISPNPLFYLAHLAGRTKRVRLGTQVVVVPWHDPVRLAEEIAMLDHMSGGRAIIGFGRGLARMEYEGLRIDQGEARQRLDETVAMVMNAMETGYIEGNGEIYKQPRREIRPTPVRSLKGRAFCAAEDFSRVHGSPPPSSVSVASISASRWWPGISRRRPSSAAWCAMRRILPPTRGWTPGRRPIRAQTPVAPLRLRTSCSSTRAPTGPRNCNERYTAKVFAAAVKNYEMTSNHHGSIKGYESYSALVMTPEGRGGDQERPQELHRRHAEGGAGAARRGAPPAPAAGDDAAPLYGRHAARRVHAVHPPVRQGMPGRDEELALALGRPLTATCQQGGGIDQPCRKPIRSIRPCSGLRRSRPR